MYEQTVIDLNPGAAVAILETHTPGIADPVRGLVRMVQVSAKLTIFDLTIRGLSPGTYHATVRATGDISQGAVSTGGIWEDEKVKDNEPSRGRLGTVEVGLTGVGTVLLDKPVEVWEIIGRSIVVSRHKEEGKFTKNDPDTIVGVIARSAGMWENEKTVRIKFFMLRA
jgi:copper chaperone for superoxide dismutase